MHYYKRNIGDYHKKAGRLSILQHGIYMLLMDAIYDREKFPTKKEAIEWVWASTTEEVEATEFVLRKFFTNGNGIYNQKRIQEEINAFHSRSEINTRIAIERETKRAKQRTKRARSDHEAPPNQEPLTTNHKPLTPIDGINPVSWGEFEQHRKEINQPLTDLARTKAMNRILKLSFDEQAICIDNTIQNRWKGLFPDKRHENNARNSESNHSRVMRRLSEKITNE